MCPFSPVNSWNQTQSFDYFEIQRKRIASVDLGWVSQALDIIQREMISSDKLSLKDVGCQMFQFYKGLKKRNKKKEDKPTKRLWWHYILFFIVGIISLFVGIMFVRFIIGAPPF